MFTGEDQGKNSIRHYVFDGMAEDQKAVRHYLYNGVNRRVEVYPTLDFKCKCWTEDI